MPLENLLMLIKKLRERIDSHGNALRQSEALTRYVLIDHFCVNWVGIPKTRMWLCLSTGYQITK